MTVTVAGLLHVANQLLDAINMYEQFATNWSDEDETVPDEVEEFVREFDGGGPEPGTSLGSALTTVVTDQYYEACETQAKYVEQAREQGCSDWSGLVEEIEPIREAIQQVHTAGYEINPETGEPGYLMPKELCPASLVSMNAGSSPVMFDDRIAQYWAVSDHFDLSPDLVYHPGSGHDVSLSEAFPETRVLYADIDEAAMADLNRAGYEAVGADATAYELTEKADVIVFRNAGLVEEAIVEVNLRTGGWVLANNHLASAEHLAELDSLELIGLVPHSWNGELPEIERGVDHSIGDHRQATKSGRTSRNTQSRQLFENGTPLDLYIFRETT